MKFTITAQTLQDELAFLAGVATSKSTTHDVLKNIIITAQGTSALQISATDLDVSLSCQVEASVSEPGSMLVPIAKLLAITKNLPKTADMVFQSLKNAGGANLTCERTSFKLLAPETEAFPEIKSPQKGTIEIPAETFSIMINSTIFAITQEESRYTLSGAKMEIDVTGIRMVTTDGHRLAKIESSKVVSDTRIDTLIPRKALAELSKLSAAHQGNIAFSLDENHIYFNLGTRALSSRLLFGQFPNYEMVLPKNNDKSIEFDCTPLNQAIRRVALMSDERSHAIRFHIEPNQLIISAQNAEEGEATEVVETTYSGDEIDIGFNAHYLQDFMNINGKNRVILEFKDGNTQAQLRPASSNGSDYRYIIMPMRL